MVVKIEEIREEGLTLHEPIPKVLLEEALTEGRDTGFRVASATELDATFHRVSSSVLVHGSFVAPLLTPCHRCLADVELKLPVTFDLSLMPKKPERGSDEGSEDDESAEDAGSFRLQDADSEVFDGKTIDLDPIVREQVLLALPMHSVCREDCKGLCGMCGQNLNEKPCGCQPKVVDVRLAVLKDIKLN